MTAASEPRPVVVLHTLVAPDGKTRFVDQMLAGESDELRVATFGWRHALLGHYDVFHVHWPEYLVRHRTIVGTAFTRTLASTTLRATISPLTKRRR